LEVSLSRSPETPSLSIEFSPNSVSECLTGVNPVPTDEDIDVQHSPNKPSSVITESNPNLVSDITVQHNPNDLSSTDIEHTPNNPISIITESEVYEASDIEVLHSPNGVSNVSIDKSPCQPCDIEAEHEPNPVAFVGFSGQPNTVDTVSIDYQPNPVSEVGYGFSPEAVSFVSAGFLYTEAPLDVSDITISHTPNQVSSVLSIDATLPDEVQEVTVSRDPELVDTVSVKSSPNSVSTVSLLGQFVPDDIDLVSVTYSSNSVSTVSTIATPNDPLSPTISSSPTKVLDVSTSKSPYRASDLSVEYSPNTLSDVESVELTEWTPQYSTAIEGWWDATDATTVTTSGSEVTAVTDKSGNGYTLEPLTNNTTGPSYGTRTLNGLNVFDFQGGNYNVLENNSFAWDQANNALGFAAVYRLDNDGITDQDFLMSGTESSSRICIRSTTSGAWQLLCSGGSLTTSSTLGTEPTTQIMVARFNAGTSSIRIDGSTEAFGSIGSVAFSSLNISGNYLEQQGVEGFIAEIIFFSDLTETQKIEGYLAHKWGLAGNLPAGHPYKSIGPKL
jgi:hypothetical protein